MMRHGDQIARGLCDGYGGDAAHGSGWRGALQQAADDSDQDPGILQIADEIYARAGRMDTAPMLYAYATLARRTARGCAAEWLLGGMLRYIVHRTDD